MARSESCFDIAGDAGGVYDVGVSFRVEKDDACERVVLEGRSMFCVEEEDMSV